MISKQIKVLSIILFSLLFSMVSVAVETQDPPIAVDRSAPQEINLLAPGDVVEISVFQHPELYRESIPIAPDGMLYYIMIDPINVSGKSTIQVAKLIEKQLERFFLYPKVNVAIVQSQGYRFYILGKVGAPGVYPLKPQMRLLEALGTAGGLSEGDLNGSVGSLVDLNRSFVIGKDGKLRKIDFKKLVKEGDMKENISLLPGDYIYLASILNQKIYVVGEVLTPRTVHYRENLTLLKLLADVPYKPQANLDKITILRQNDKIMKLLVVNMNKILNLQAEDIAIQADDIVFVPPKGEFPFSDLFELAKRAFVSTYTTKKALLLYDKTINDIAGE